MSAVKKTEVLSGCERTRGRDRERLGLLSSAPTGLTPERRRRKVPEPGGHSRAAGPGAGGTASDCCSAGAGPSAGAAGTGAATGASAAAAARPGGGAGAAAAAAGAAGAGAAGAAAGAAAAAAAGAAGAAGGAGAPAGPGETERTVTNGYASHAPTPPLLKPRHQKDT